MDTIDFIRHHTRMILEEEGKYKTRKGLGAGAASGAAKQALGLAASNPEELLKRLKVDKYKTRGSSKIEEVINFLNEVISKSKMGIAFSKAEKSGSNIEIPIAMLDEKNTTINKDQAPRYIKASLLAGGLGGLIDFELARDKVSLAGTGKGESETYAVIVKYVG